VSGQVDAVARGRRRELVHLVAQRRNLVAGVVKRLQQPFVLPEGLEELLIGLARLIRARAELGVDLDRLQPLHIRYSFQRADASLTSQRSIDLLLRWLATRRRYP
jgi:hypothetical protein